MITFNSVTAYKTTTVRDSLNIQYTSVGDTVAKVYIDHVSNYANIASTTDSDHDIVLDDASLFVSGTEVIITPVELAAEGYTSTYEFAEMYIITLTDATNTFTYQYAFYDTSHLYYIKATLLNLSTLKTVTEIRYKKALVNIVLKEMLLKNAQVLGLIDDCVTYYQGIEYMCANPEYNDSFLLSERIQIP